MSESSPKDDELAGTEQPFVQHLMELRDRLLYCIYGIGVGIAVLMFWPGPDGLIDFIAMPIKEHMPPGAKLIAVGVFSPFFVPLKVLMMVAVLLALPWLMYQVWAFVAPGLYSHEKKFALPLILFGSLLAYAGIAFVQFFVLGNMFKFIQHFTPSSVAATPDIASYVEAILSLYIAFAAAFQVPIVVMLLVRFGLVEIEKLKSFRGYFVVLAFVIAAVITPPDVISQLALAIPMCLLYEVGILGAGWFSRISKAPDEAEASDAAMDKPADKPADGS
ncbi:MULTISPECIES: twin-arginine translocase subunit TatC [unclassified Comamonas]|uniref:twin-arginine translocase subunit TatC n=1 Tax=unclassified Comamonas TaxID=2638500 RepID=UPI000EAFD0CB|nr:twin-arginine translocase subunit TatC [Comamonas sp. lk]